MWQQVCRGSEGTSTPDQVVCRTPPLVHNNTRGLLVGNAAGSFGELAGMSLIACPLLANALLDSSHHRLS
jgi:hypothetical protein